MSNGRYIFMPRKEQRQAATDITTKRILLIALNNDYVVPNQFSHNLALSYSLQNGRYNVSLECRNFTNENLYDNFSLQKAGRAFYGKVRVYFGN